MSDTPTIERLKHAAQTDPNLLIYADAIQYVCGEITKLKQTVEEYREMFDSCLKTGGERLREIAKLKQERDEAYERAAISFENEARTWNELKKKGILIPVLHQGAKAIRALKSEPTEGK